MRSDDPATWSFFELRRVKRLLPEEFGIGSAAASGATTGKAAEGPTSRADSRPASFGIDLKAGGPRESCMVSLPPSPASGAKEIPPGDFGNTLVGDETDTSPDRDSQAVNGSSTTTFIRNLGVLIQFLNSER